ncbi:hypothetical protein DZB77_08210 [Salmonella enterica]|nr:hypothetical protein [Salmonella enterica]EBJ0300809.1 hypothetical protein [Salmonella enterica]EBM4187502.1 hypothetical protein [Salmonella enterica]EBT7096804.1 hypothetical protein [Salmonella enterica]
MYSTTPCHTSSCKCVGCVRSPQSLTYVSSWGFSYLPPSCNSNYFGYSYRQKTILILLEKIK